MVVGIRISGRRRAGRFLCPAASGMDSLGREPSLCLKSCMNQQSARAESWAELPVSSLSGFVTGTTGVNFSCEETFPRRVLAQSSWEQNRARAACASQIRTNLSACVIR